MVVVGRLTNHDARGAKTRFGWRLFSIFDPPNQCGCGFITGLGRAKADRRQFKRKSALQERIVINAKHGNILRNGATARTAPLDHSERDFIAEGKNCTMRRQPL